MLAISSFLGTAPFPPPRLVHPSLIALVIPVAAHRIACVPQAPTENIWPRAPTTSSPSIPRCHIGFFSGFSLVSVYLILIALLDSRATPPATATTDRIHDDRSHSGSADDPLQTLDAQYLKIVVPPPNKRRAD